MPKSKRKGRKLVEETLLPTDPALHHHISTETRNKVDIADFLDANEGDPALTVCYNIHLRRLSVVLILIFSCT
jgi:hypothetical protein